MNTIIDIFTETGIVPDLILLLGLIIIAILFWESEQ